MSNAGIVKKIIIKGELLLESPLLIGSGEKGVETDIHVLKNRAGAPFIPGTSLAGALRAAMSEDAAAELFGQSNPKNARQSLVAIDDIVLKGATLTVRDGVSLENYTKTTVKGQKYNYEAVERGARGELYIEATVRRVHGDATEVENKLWQHVAQRLALGLHVGALTTKGFGRVRLVNGKFSSYDFRDFAAVSNYLEGYEAAGTRAVELDPQAVQELSKDALIVVADFALESALLVRDYADTAEDDKITARQKKSGNDYLIPGTSIKGALRHRAVEIVDMLGKKRSIVDELMGQSASVATKQKSRLTVEECYISAGVRSAQQSRNRIDRFTGGTIDGALFTEVPVWQEHDGEPTVSLRFSVREASDVESGLMLYLLRELWTGRLPLGGEASIGRGALRGLGARIDYHGAHYELDDAGRVVTGRRAELESLAKAFCESEDATDE